MAKMTKPLPLNTHRWHWWGRKYCWEYFTSFFLVKPWHTMSVCFKIQLSEIRTILITNTCDVSISTLFPLIFYFYHLASMWKFAQLLQNGANGENLLAYPLPVLGVMDMRRKYNRHLGKGAGFTVCASEFCLCHHPVFVHRIMSSSVCPTCTSKKHSSCLPTQAARSFPCFSLSSEEPQ